MYVFFILIWRFLTLYVQYSLNQTINIFFPENLVDSTIRVNTTGTGKREEGALLNENICDS